MTKNHAEAAWAEGEEGLSIDALRRFLRDRLPEHMVPSFFVLLEDLPLTPNGKIDRRALELVGAEGFVRRDGDAPATPVEEILAGLWSEVLGIPRPARHDSFFDLGGHSLLATQVHSRMRAAFGVEIPLRLLFEEPTLAALGAAVERALAAGDAGAANAAGSAPPIEPRPPGDDTELPLSFAQQRLWFLAQLDPASPAYNVPIALRFSGRLDRGALAACLTAVAARHEALRTTFVPSADDPGRPVQRIAPPVPVPLPLVDLAGLPDPEPEARRLALEEELRPFDLTRGPLLRSTLLGLGEDDHAILFNLHHIISDGWSTGVLVSEVAALYGAFLEGRPSPLPPLPVQYADFARWQRTWLQGEALRAQIAFWRERLAGAPPALEIPADRPRPAAPTGQGGVRRPHLSRAITDGLNAYARRHGVTLFMVLLAGWKSLLHRLTGETDLLIGSPIANRTRPEIEGLIGFFVNTLVLRTDLSGGPSFREAVGRVRETALAAYAHQDLPFERLVEVLVPERSLARTPFFQVMVALQNAPQGDLTLPGLTLAALPVEGKTAKFDITLELYEAPDGIRGRCEYSSDLFDGPTLDRLLGQWAVLLEGALADPRQPLAALPLLPEAERHQTLVEWNAPAWTAAPDEPVHRRFLAEAARTPERVAVIAAGETVTYGEIADRALRLAARLRGLGVGADVPVGVFLPRGAGLLAAMVGVWEAGGAYLPLDPAYPRERLAFMLADTGAPVVVTEAGLVEELAPHPGKLVLLEENAAGSAGVPPAIDFIGRQDAGAPSRGISGSAVHPETLSYVVYTSGSTGRPKGIALPHRVLSTLIDWQLGDWALPPGTGVRTLMFASPSFDASLHESLATLLAGGTLVVATEEHRRDPESLLRWMIEARVERFFLPFVAFQQLAEVAARDGLAPEL
ncbi:MAG TPA: condensation domain-containing protein, partial [Thermoanaerobaculia bacterium]|nr:condensation domain-containing protein [Thermoanaerobaculia bacterium]